MELNVTKATIYTFSSPDFIVSDGTFFVEWQEGCGKASVWVSQGCQPHWVTDIIIIDPFASYDETYDIILEFMSDFIAHLGKDHHGEN